MNKRIAMIGALVAMFVTSVFGQGLPQGFVYLDEHVPGVLVDLRYADSHNFVGRPIIGYVSHRPVLTSEAALALKAAQEDLAAFGLQLKIFDAYRPQQAVDDFVAWAKDPAALKQKSEFYPKVDKSALFSDGYIAERSGHSRGSTVDLTIANQTTPYAELDMGTPFDFFGPESWPDSAAVSLQQRANRLLLQSLMVKHGFKAYQQEWWHFTFGNEPFPETYFNFVVQ